MKLPSGNYQYKLYIGTVDGKKKYKSFTAKSDREARRAADRWQTLHASMADDPSLAEACDAFLAGRTDVLSPSTYKDYSNRIQYLKKMFPDLFKTKLSAVTTQNIQMMVNRLAVKPNERTGKPISPKTVMEYYSVIATVLSSYGITLSPIKLPQRKPPTLNVPEEETIKALLSAIKGTELEVPVILAALGPMRRGEICALTMDDIDGNVITVSKSMVLNENHEWILKLPKSASGFRSIEYPEHVIKLIHEQGLYQGNPDMLTKQFSRTLKRLGMEHFRFHDLRHYSASFQLSLGIPSLYVMDRGGWHSDASMKRYLHALDKQKKEFSDKANSAFGKLFE